MRLRRDDAAPALAPFMPGDAGCLALFSAAYAGIAFAGANSWSLPADVARARSMWRR